ncbi:LysR family transcriptional regulator [Sphingobium sp. EM0848]|uniref:LysR family transcriptional regulator n=1 Tax=Sphingobium sp. EM0848 TaxID=2743473 RepID=UPI00159C5894|nr:LysR family transcriptional regulator [Sphingobium sp. EM0848]
MPAIGTPSIDQIHVFLTVVETGSFAGAGRKLGRATSAVSYTIANLEMQLGVQLFDREHTRKPMLTDAGNAILSKAREVANGVDDLRATVKGLNEGLESEVAVVVDVMLPPDRLAEAVQAFEACYPTVKLHLFVEALSAVSQMVRKGGAMVGIGGGMDGTTPELEMISIGAVDMFPVAAPSHPLAQIRSGKPGEARRYRQLILTVRSAFNEGRDAGIFSSNSWRLADLGAKHALLLAGVGWGNMPEPSVREDLANGRLVRLDIPEIGTGNYPLHAMYRTNNPPGPAARWLIEHFVGQAR